MRREAIARTRFTPEQIARDCRRLLDTPDCGDAWACALYGSALASSSMRYQFENVRPRPMIVPCQGTGKVIYSAVPTTRTWRCS